MLSLTFFLASFPGAQAEKKLKRAGAVHIRWAFPPLPEKAQAISQGLTVERDTSIENYGYHAFEIEFTIDRDPGNSQEFSFSTHLDIGTPALSSNCYFGIRTDLYGRGRGVSITRCGTHDLSNASIPPGCPEKKAWMVSTPVQGGFTEARYLFDWKKGSYTMRLGLEKEEKRGRWYGLWIIPLSRM